MRKALRRVDPEVSAVVEHSREWESAVYQFCDACKGRIHSKITVINVDSGELIRLSSGREHLRSDMKTRLHVLCSTCGTRAADLLLQAVREPGALSPSG